MFMEWMHDLWLRVKALIKRRQLDRDLADELEFHLTMREQKLIEQGMSPREAHYAARRGFGNVVSLKETSRDLWSFPSLESLLQDVRYGLRPLRRSPGFTALAVLTLALGIGGTTAVFSLMDALVLKMLPVRNPQELVGILDTVSFPAYKKLRDRNHLLSGLAATSFFRADVRIDGEAEPVQGQIVTGNYYALLGVVAVQGRVLSPEDDQTPGVGGPQGPVAVISYAYWKRRFALDPSVVGKTITLNGVPVTIVGVTTPQFFGVVLAGNPLDITVPMMLQPRVMPDNCKELWVNGQQGSVLEYDASDACGWRPMIARLKPGVTAAQARAELNVLYQQVLAERAGASTDERQQRENRERKLEVLPAGNGLFRDGFDYLPEPGQYTALHLVAIMAAPGLVLLIACANVANLLLVRGTARQKESALRLAIGASRSRLVRQFLAESGLLALIGGALGVAVGGWGRDLLLAHAHPWGLPRIDLPAETDSGVLIFGVAATLVAVILFGLAPAFQSAKSNLANMLKGGPGDQKDGTRRLDLGKVLVVAQIALSLPLLAGAGLLARSLHNKMIFDPGFDRENLLLFSTEFHGSNVSRTGTLLRETQERMAGLPGARAVGMSQLPPPLASGWQDVSGEGMARLPREKMRARQALVGPGYLEAAGIPLLAGRDLSTRDNENAPKVCVINAAMAAKFWPNSNPIGRRYTVLSSDSDYQVEVVGVAKDVRGYWLGDDRLPLAYCPMLQYLPANSLTVLVRVAGAPAAVIAEVRRRFQEIDPNLFLDVKNWRTFNSDMEFESICLSRLSAGLSLMALLLTCIGLYGVLAYSVVRRANEIGIRMALGAGRGDVVRLILRQTLRLVVIGITVGLAVSQAFTRIMVSLLFGVKPTDVATISLAMALLVVVALFAGYLPARRAASLDPLVALKYE